MTSTLLLRLAGPMQSWGTRSRFTERDTEMEPSKSGVVGLLCAAIGRPRRESVKDLADLRMGVRVDFPGAMAMDYHTAGAGYGIAKSSGQLDSSYTALSNRYYLADADFLVGLEGHDAALLGRLEAALRAPVWQLCLGRKAFVPGIPVYLPGDGGLREGKPLEDALKSEPWPRPGIPLPAESERPKRLRLVLEHDTGATNEVRMDQPVGAAFETRRFAPRYVGTSFVPLGDEIRLRARPEPVEGKE